MNQREIGIFLLGVVAGVVVATYAFIPFMLGLE